MVSNLAHFPPTTIRRLELPIGAGRSRARETEVAPLVSVWEALESCANESEQSEPGIGFATGQIL